MRAAGTLFRDVLFLLIGVLVLMIMILIPWINEGLKRQADDIVYEEITVEIRWPDGQPDDVDMWLRPPDGRPIGYSSKNGPLCDLLRDDLGSPGDPIELNYEVSRCRKAVDGEYVLNLHLYTHRSREPIPVRWAIRMKTQPDGIIRVVATGTETLVSQGQEVTLMVMLISDGVYRNSYRPVRTIPLRSAK